MPFFGGKPAISQPCENSHIPRAKMLDFLFSRCGEHFSATSIVGHIPRPIGTGRLGLGSALYLGREVRGDETVGRRRPPRHRPGDPFTKGPIAYEWIASACRLPGAGLHVTMAYRFDRGRFRFNRRGRRWGLPEVAVG